MTTPIRRGACTAVRGTDRLRCTQDAPLRDGTLEQGSSHKKILGAIDKVGMLS